MITGPIRCFTARYADLLFEVVKRRYDLGKPIVLSTNKAFSEWGEVFPHAACVVTLSLSASNTERSSSWCLVPGK